MKLPLTVGDKSQDPTDYVRWSNEGSLLPAWRARSEEAAQLIPRCASVLDLGAGRMTLRELLDPTNEYTPADLVRRCDDCLVVNLNQHELPSGSYDVVTVLGVLEYVIDPAWLLRGIAVTAPRLILSYFAYDGVGLSDRIANGWLNALSHQELMSLLTATGWQLVISLSLPKGELLLSCRLACDD